MHRCSLRALSRAGAVLSVLGLAVIALFCRPLVRPTPISRAAQTVTVLYSGDIDWTLLPRFAALVKAEKPDLSVIGGRFLTDGPVRYLLLGEAECQALAASGIDAVRLTPDFLGLGLKTARRLADSLVPPVFLLSGNVWDSSRQSLFGPAFLRRAISLPAGSLRIGLIGLAGNGSSPFWNQPGIAWQNPDSAARHLLPVVRMSSDLVGIVSEPGAAPELTPGADFVIGSDKSPLPATSSLVNRLELGLDAQNRVVVTRITSIDLQRLKPDSVVLALVRKLEQRADSLLDARVNETKVELDIKALTGIALKTTSSRAHAEGALFGNSLVLKPLGIGDISLRRLFDVTGPGNQLLKLRIEGQEFEKFPPPGEPGVEWRSILKHQRIMLRRQYDIVATLEYVVNHPVLMSRRLDFLPLSLAEVYAFALRDRSKAKPDSLE